MNAKQPNPLPTPKDLAQANRNHEKPNRDGLPPSYDQRGMTKEGGYSGPPPKPKPEPPKYPPKS